MVAALIGGHRADYWMEAAVAHSSLYTPERSAASWCPIQQRLRAAGWQIHLCLILHSRPR
jgi:hypothetical protein